MEHGGMWADVFVISPIVAYAASKYKFDVSFPWGLGLLAASIVIVLGMIEIYRRAGITMPDHCTHNGETVLAGWIHGLFAVAAIWVCLEIYLGLSTPIVSKQDIVIFSILLTPFFYLGVAKLSARWVFSTQDKYQVAIMTALVWFVAVIRLVRT